MTQSNSAPFTIEVTGAENANPDSLPAATATHYANDYETQNDADVISQAGIALMSWSPNGGYGDTGGWRATPDPVTGTAQQEDSAGWFAGQLSIPFDSHDLWVVSYVLKISGTLLSQIDTVGFWAHVNKCFDFKYWSSTSGEGNRNGFHFGENPPRFWSSSGGGGQLYSIGPDWRTLADQWVWIAHVVDMRGADPATRYIATYYKTQAMSAVTRMGITYESEGLQSYDGYGIAGLYSPLWGYWDDMNNQENLADPASMAVWIDRVRSQNGWPTGTDGPPF